MNSWPMGLQFSAESECWDARLPWPGNGFPRASLEALCPPGSSAVPRVGLEQGECGTVSRAGGQLDSALTREVKGRGEASPLSLVTFLLVNYLVGQNFSVQSLNKLSFKKQSPTFIHGFTTTMTTTVTK